MLSTSRVSAVLPFNGIEKAEAFYVKKLGLKLIDGSGEDGHFDFEAGDGTTLSVFESDSDKTGNTAACFDVADLAKEMADLKKKGVAFEDYDLPNLKTVNGVHTGPEGKVAWIKDPGGNVICLHQRA